LYAVAFTIFVIASVAALAFPLEILGFPFSRTLPDLVAGVTGVGGWTTWLLAACFYCITAFVLTTLLILDVETLRNSLLTWNPRFFRGSRIDEFLHDITVRRHLVENGYRRGFLRRVREAVTWLAVWTVYLVCVFTSLQTGLRPSIAADSKLADVMQVFG